MAGSDLSHVAGCPGPSPFEPDGCTRLTSALTAARVRRRMWRLRLDGRALVRKILGPLVRPALVAALKPGQHPSRTNAPPLCNCAGSQPPLLSSQAELPMSQRRSGRNQGAPPPLLFEPVPVVRRPARLDF